MNTYKRHLALTTVFTRIDLPLWTAPSCAGLLMLFTCYCYGAFDYPTSTNALRIFNGALAMPFFITYAWIAVKVMKKRAISRLREFENRSSYDLSHINFQQNIEYGFNKNLVIALCGGLVSCFFYLYFEDLITRDVSSALWLMNVIAIPFWVSIWIVILQLVFLTQYVIKHFLDNEKIDLFGLKSLLPISDLVVTNTIISTFGLALIPLFWIGRDIPSIDKIIVFVIFVLLSSYLFWPVIKVQRIISRKKRLAISRINVSFQRLFDRKFTHSRRLTDDPTRLRKLSSLISAKQEISSASEWPINLPQGIKGILIFISIPLSWAAGSVVETIISTLY